MVRCAGGKVLMPFTTPGRSYARRGGVLVKLRAISLALALGAAGVAAAPVGATGWDAGLADIGASSVLTPTQTGSGEPGQWGGWGYPWPGGNPGGWGGTSGYTWLNPFSPWGLYPFGGGYPPFLGVAHTIFTPPPMSNGILSPATAAALMGTSAGGTDAGSMGSGNPGGMGSSAPCSSGPNYMAC